VGLANYIAGLRIVVNTAVQPVNGVPVLVDNVPDMRHPPSTPVEDSILVHKGLAHAKRQFVLPRFL